MDKKNFAIVGFIAVAVVAASALIYFSLRSGSMVNVNEAVTAVPGANTAADLQRRSRSGTTDLTFQEAYDQYYDHRFQIADCVATPPRITLKNGTKLMLDNRSAEPLVVTLGGKTYRLYEYDFSIITVTSGVLPTTLQMDCQMGDQVGKNIAQVLVEK
jgi:hypothetical protein